MNDILYKIYEGTTKEMIYTTFDIDNAVRKYFMCIRKNPTIEIWEGKYLLGKYNVNIYDLKAIKRDLEAIIKVA